MKRKILLLLCLLLAAVGTIQAEDLAIFDKMIATMNESYSRINSYSVYFIKQEFFPDQGMVTEHMDLIFKKPFQVKMTWREGSKQAYTIVYQEGKNDNELKVKRSGLFFTFSLDPRGDMAMKNNHHPVTDSGIGKTIELITSNYRPARQNKDLKIIDHGITEIHHLPVYHLEVILPADKAKGYYCRRLIIYLDKTSCLPVNLQIFDWQNKLYENYTYLELHPNIQINEKTFEL